MHYKQITRTNPGTGALERPWRNRDHFFTLGDPAKGKVKHHDEHAVKVDNYGEALELVEAGFSIRMSDGRSSPSLVSPGSITLIDKPVRSLDELWVYTMPELPFTRDQLERDIRSALLSKAGELYTVADSAAANAFIGFDLDVDEVEHGKQAEQIDLGRFNFSRVVMNAFESAFRTGASKLISDEDVDELELMIGALFSAGPRRYVSPADIPGSPLRRTMLAAYLRWKLSEGNMFEHKLDQSAVESLAALVGMSDQAVRNSLSKERLSPVKGKLEYDPIVRWLENRRDFVPLRESERPQARSTWAAVANLKRLPILDALELARTQNSVATDLPRLQALESEIAERVTSGETPSQAILREYARAIGLSIDTFVLEFPKAAAAGAKGR